MTAEPRVSRAHQDNPFLAALRSGAVLADGATGSLLFELTGRLSERNHVYEALNIENPDLVSQVHRLYLQAGASALKTNTFGANAASLARLGIVDRVDEINRAAVRLARASIEQIAAAEAGDSPQRFVLGSIGPVFGDETVEAIYGSQLRALIEAGVDALLFETFESLESASAVVRYANRFEGCPPVKEQGCYLAMHKNGRIYRVIPLPFEQGCFFLFRDKGMLLRVLKFPLDGGPMSYWIGEESAYET